MKIVSKKFVGYESFMKAINEPDVANNIVAINTYVGSNDFHPTYSVFFKRKVSKIRLLPCMNKGQFLEGKIYDCIEDGETTLLADGVVFASDHNLHAYGEDGGSYIIPYSELDFVWEDVTDEEES